MKKKTYKRHLIILMALMACAFGWPAIASAQEKAQHATKSWNKETSNGSYDYYTLDGNVTLSSTITLTGNLTIKIESTGTHHSISKNFNGTMFEVGAYTLTIIGGGQNKEIKLDGGAVFSPSQDARINPIWTNDSVSSITTAKTGTLIDCTSGNVYVERAIMQNCSDGCAIHLQGGSASSRPTCEVKHTLIKGIYSGAGGAAVLMDAGDFHRVTLTDVEIKKCCTSRYPAVSSFGTTGSILTIDNCYLHHNRGVLGGAVFWTAAAALDCKATIKGGTRICYNNADCKKNGSFDTDNGGGIYIEAKMEILSATISGNTALNGGGISLGCYSGGENPNHDGSGFELIVNENVTISNNSAWAIGGGVNIELRSTASIGFNPDNSPRTAEYKFELDGGSIYGNQARYGGGVGINDHCPDYNTRTGGIRSGLLTKVVNIKSGSIYGNRAHSTTIDGVTESGLGGGIYIWRHDGADSENHVGKIDVNITGGEVFQNVVGDDNGSGGITGSGSGGGFYILNDYTGAALTSSQCNVKVSGTAQLYGNTCRDFGAGIYLDRGTFEMTGGTIGKSGETQVPGSSPAVNKSNKNVASQDGGGFYILGGSCSVKGGTISYNKATRNGGGFYVNPGSGTTTTINNTSGTTSITYNEAANGAGVYVESGTTVISGGNITNNDASTDGGGIYTKSTLQFSNGSISNNTATGNGGGAYVYATGGRLEISGSATISGNSVTSGQGGGVYMAGSMLANSSSLTVSGNTKGQTANNVYLPHNIMIEVGSSISANVNLGIYTEKTYEQNGNTHIKVLTGNEGKLGTIYTAMTSGSSNIRDDRGTHRAEYTSGQTILYFTKVFFDRGPYTTPYVGPINSVDSLYKFMCWVNGLNGFGEPHPNAEGNVTADISLSGITYWFPIGSPNVVSATTPYTGVFNGNGHNIDNLTIEFNNGNGYDLIKDWGLFGIIDGTAEINDLCLKNTNVYNKSNEGGVGTLVGKMLGGTVRHCMGAGIVRTNNSGCVVGGLVGIKSGGTIHSSFATVTLGGYRRGGLVGENSGYIYNCYARSNFEKNTANTDYMGGLVGVNNGRVENCYARMYTDPSQLTGKFGWLAGSNTSASGMGLYYCYAPALVPDPDDPYYNPYTYIASGGTAGTQVGLGTYTRAASTMLEDDDHPYEYKRHDNQVTASSNPYVPTIANKQLVKTLNNWVAQDAAHEATYDRWLRTTTSCLNGDCPVLRLPKVNSLACYPGSMVLRYGDINNNLVEFDDSRYAICFYGSKAGMNSNGDCDALLYIDQDAVFTPAAGATITGYVGVTLDNSAGSGGAHPSGGGTDAIDWHFFSSVLTDAKIGLHYDDNSSYGYGVYPSWHATFTATGAADSYFPTNLDSYYNDWDLYAYYEPDYHWINLKRNSHSHWHEDANHLGEHAWIDYTNDTRFEPGHGYMVALAEEHYLQAYGTLNTHSSGSPLEVDVTYTPGISWTTREGQNLLGNPYQSYLDFNAFVDANRGLWASGTTPFYIVMDEDKKDYVIYAYTASKNTEAQASRYIHPHQGFMIKIKEGTSGKAKFHDGMRTTTMASSWTSSFRDGDSQLDYPLVNLFVRDKNGNRDIVTVELGRPEKGGVPKSQVPGTSTGRISCHYEGESYALAFTEPGLDVANIRFATEEDGEYTMTWSTHNGEFSYLHLIDNIAGKDIDCLQETEYTFTSKTTDYAGRFRLVFDYTGVEENGEDSPSTGSEAFAFISNGNIVINGAGTLQVIDVLGRQILTKELSTANCQLSTVDFPAGVYILRLTTANGTRTQKIILN